MNWLSILSFEYTTDRTVNRKYYLPIAEIKDYNVMIYGQNCFNQPVKNNFRTYEKLRLVKEIIGELVANGIIVILIKTIKW